MSKMKSTISKMERDLIDFSLGKKKPKTRWEKKLVKEIKAIKKEGGMIEIPCD